MPFILTVKNHDALVVHLNKAVTAAAQSTRYLFKDIDQFLGTRDGNGAPMGAPDWMMLEVAEKIEAVSRFAPRRTMRGSISKEVLSFLARGGSCDYVDLVQFMDTRQREHCAAARTVLALDDHARSKNLYETWEEVIESVKIFFNWTVELERAVALEAG